MTFMFGTTSGVSKAALAAASAPKIVTENDARSEAIRALQLQVQEVIKSVTSLSDQIKVSPDTEAGLSARVNQLNDALTDINDELGKDLKQVKVQTAKVPRLEKSVSQLQNTTLPALQLSLTDKDRQIKELSETVERLSASLVTFDAKLNGLEEGEDLASIKKAFEDLKSRFKSTTQSEILQNKTQELVDKEAEILGRMELVNANAKVAKESEREIQELKTANFRKNVLIGIAVVVSALSYAISSYAAMCEYSNSSFCPKMSPPPT